MSFFATEHGKCYHREGCAALHGSGAPTASGAGLSPCRRCRPDAPTAPTGYRFVGGSGRKRQRKPKGTDGRALNQFHGNLYEVALVESISDSGLDAFIASEGAQELIDRYRDTFGEDYPRESLSEEYADAEAAIKILNEHFSSNSIKSAERIGQNTKSEDGDVLLILSDGSTVTLEVKYTEDGSGGTYANQSINNVVRRYQLMDLGVEIPKGQLKDKDVKQLIDEHKGNGTLHEELPTYKDFLLSEGYYDDLEEILGPSIVNKGTDSPVTARVSSDIRHGRGIFGAGLGERIAKVEQGYRSRYVRQFMDVLEKHGLVQQFANDCASKKASDKKAADLYLITHKGTAESRLVDGETFSRGVDASSYRISENGNMVTFADGLTVVFGWQNGVGLNNPTIRTFQGKRIAE